MTLRHAAITVTVALAGCTFGEAICRCALEACAGSICGQAVRIAGDRALHRVDPDRGSTTVCDIEIGERDPVVLVEDAEDELRAGGGHAPCWRPRDEAH